MWLSGILTKSLIALRSVFALLLVRGNHYAATENVLKDNVANVCGKLNYGVVDKLHALEHLFLGNSGLGLAGYDTAVAGLSGGGDSSHRITALVLGISRAALTDISADREDALAIKLNRELAASGADDTG
jgi:hypothetical protein